MVGKKMVSDLNAAQLTEDPEQYGVAFLLSALLWAVLISGLVFALAIFVQGRFPEEVITPVAMIGLLMFAVFFVLHRMYPSIIAKRIADEADRQLIFVLRDLWIQSTSGVPLYVAISNIARGNYGIISTELHAAVSKIAAGERDITVLERVASTTRSEAFRRALWDVTTSLKTGVGLTAALESALNARTASQRMAIKSYGASLNFYLLLYLLFAAVVPAVFTTLLSILSVFGILSITIETILVVVVISFIVQLVLLGFMRAGRPEIGI